jgi:hypothetical protein
VIFHALNISSSKEYAKRKLTGDPDTFTSLNIDANLMPLGKNAVSVLKRGGYGANRARKKGQNVHIYESIMKS